MRFIDNIKIVFVSLIIISAFSCKKEEEKKTDIIAIDYSYFPQKVGSYIIYQAQNIVIDAPSERYDTINYQIKEVYESTFIDNSGNLCYRLERYKRNNDTLPWVINSVWVSQITNNSAIRVEDNVRLVKIKFPVKVNLTWDGNIFNTLDSLDFKITDIDKRETIKNTVFDSVLTVTQQDDENIIEKFYTAEKFGKNIGLIYKENINIESMYVLPGVPYYTKIKIGSLYKQQYLSSGNK